MFGGATGHPSDVITAASSIAAGRRWSTRCSRRASSRLVADKVISGFVGLAIIRALPPRYTAGLQLPAEVGMRTLLVATLGTVAGIAILLVYLLVLAPPAAA